MVGKFVVIEGPHGSGKTTAAKLLVRELRKRKIPAIYTKEPYSSRLKPVIEEFSETGLSNPTALAFLIAADRSIHLARISKWVKQGRYVVCDRYKLSSLVYQRIDGLNESTIDQINGGFREPDFTFLLDVPFELRLKRLVDARQTRNHRFFKLNALRKEQEIYSGYSQSKIHNLKVINGTAAPKQIVDEISKCITKIS